MDIYWYGQACFKLKGKSACAIIDPFNPEFIGLKLPKASDWECDAVLVTHEHGDHAYVKAVPNEPVLIYGPGEYEVKGISVVGVQTYHDKNHGQERGKNTVYSIYIDGLRLVHLGDLGHVLTQEQVEEIGETDILMVPVGGTYTIDAKEAVEVISQLEPKVIIPMHYAQPGLKVNLEPVETFLKEMGTESVTPVNKLSMTKEKLPDEPQVVVLNRS